MNLEDYRTLFIVVGLILIIAVASPIISAAFPFSRTPEPFSELWILGSDSLTDGYPLDVTVGTTYSIWLGVGNRLGALAYYAVYSKVSNQSELLPDVTLGLPSSLPALSEYRLFLGDDQFWKENVTFSLSGVVFEVNRVRISYVFLDGHKFFVNATVVWDSLKRGYFLELFFELWLYDVGKAYFSYHARFVNLRLNVTSSSLF